MLLHLPPEKSGYSLEGARCDIEMCTPVTRATRRNAASARGPLFTVPYLSGPFQQISSKSKPRKLVRSIRRSEGNKQPRYIPKFPGVIPGFPNFCRGSVQNASRRKGILLEALIKVGKPRAEDYAMQLIRSFAFWLFLLIGRPIPGWCHSSSG